MPDFQRLTRLIVKHALVRILRFFTGYAAKNWPAFGAARQLIVLELETRPRTRTRTRFSALEREASDDASVNNVFRHHLIPHPIVIERGRGRVRVRGRS